MKQFITILLISLCLTQLTFGRLSKECVDDDTKCTYADFSKTNHSVDDDSAIVCDGAAIMGQIGDNGEGKCYGIFDGCFGKGEDEKNQVTCTAVTNKCVANPAAAAPGSANAGACTETICNEESTCGSALDAEASPVPCCVGRSKDEIQAECTAWQNSLHCAPSLLKIALLWLAPIIILAVVIARAVDKRGSGITGSEGSTGGYVGLVRARGRNARVNF